MPGITDHLRQFTSTVYTPFHFYSKGNTNTVATAPIVEFSMSESPATNEILVIPFRHSQVENDAEGSIYEPQETEVANIDIYALMPMEHISDNKIKSVREWVKTGTVAVADGEMISISPLYATAYKLISNNANLTLNIAKNDVNITTKAEFVPQTWPRVSWGSITQDHSLDATYTVKNPSGLPEDNYIG